MFHVECDKEKEILMKVNQTCHSRQTCVPVGSLRLCSFLLSLFWDPLLKTLVYSYCFTVKESFACELLFAIKKPANKIINFHVVTFKICVGVIVIFSEKEVVSNLYA